MNEIMIATILERFKVGDIVLLHFKPDNSYISGKLTEIIGSVIGVESILPVENDYGVEPISKVVTGYYDLEDIGKISKMEYITNG